MYVISISEILDLRQGMLCFWSFWVVCLFVCQQITYKVIHSFARNNTRSVSRGKEWSINFWDDPDYEFFVVRRRFAVSDWLSSFCYIFDIILNRICAMVNRNKTRKSCSETNTKAAIRYRQSAISNLI